MIEIEGYEAIERIGHGGLGDVYRATRISTGGTVAVKVLRDVSDESVVWHRTRRELTALVALAGHGNVIQLLELLDLPEGPALVMEYAPGGSVAGLMGDRDEPLAVAEIVLIGRQTAAALVAAHQQGIVHRDVKPQNLLIDAYGQVKLCDFGVAALTRTDDFRTRTNALSMRYASPEDLDDEIDVGPESDIYSLGATLLHLAHGAPPTLKERLAPWVGPETDDDELAALDAVIAMCLQPDPGRRPIASELLDQLERIDWTLGERCRALSPIAAGAAAAEVAGDPAPIGAESHAPHSDDDTVHRGPPRPAPEPATAVPRRRRAPAIALGLLALAVVAGAVAFVWWRDDDTTAAPRGDATTGVSTTVPDTTHDTTDDTAPTTTPTTRPEADTDEGLSIVARPADLAPIDDPAVVWPFGEPGECLRQDSDVGELVTVACDEPHDLQRYAVAELDESVGVDDDAAALRATVDTACRAAFAPFVGVAYDDSELDAPFTLPSADTWAAGDRRYQCFVGLAGARLVGDATGSGR